MSRADEMETPTHLGRRWPLVPFAPPADLGAVEVGVLLGAFVFASTILPLTGLEGIPLEGTGWSMMAAACVLVWWRPQGRGLWEHALVWLRYGVAATGSQYVDDEDGSRLFQRDMEGVIGIRLASGVDAAYYVETPPLWGIVQRIPVLRTRWQERHNPCRSVLAIEPEGSLQLLTDDERAARMRTLASSLRTLDGPVQFVVRVTAADPSEVVQRAIPPAGSPFEFLRLPIEQWARTRAQSMLYRNIYAVVGAPDEEAIADRVADAREMLSDAGMVVRPLDRMALRQLRLKGWGDMGRWRDGPVVKPEPMRLVTKSQVWVTLVVTSFPRHCVVGWVSYVLRQLPVDMSMGVMPDSGGWINWAKRWFEAIATMPTADEHHRTAADDLARVDGKLTRNEDSLQRVTLYLSAPEALLRTVERRLRKAGAVYYRADGEHAQGRRATLPGAAWNTLGKAMPLDGASVAGAYPFGSSGLWTRNGRLLGVAADSVDRKAPREPITLDPLDDALRSSGMVILGATGSGKTFLIQLLIARLGLPFTLIDLKPHVSETQHGDYWRFVQAAKGDYCVVGKDPMPAEPHPVAQAYNLAMLDEQSQGEALREIAEKSWARALDTLEPRAFAVDEGWLLGATSAGKLFTERVIRQGRSAAFVPIMASQQVNDYTRDERMRSVVANAPMAFILGQEDAEVDVVCERLGLSVAVADYLRTCTPRPDNEEDARSRKGILKVGRRLLAVSIEASPEEYALYTTKPADLRAMRAARQGTLVA